MKRINKRILYSVLLLIALSSSANGMQNLRRRLTTAKDTVCAIPGQVCHWTTNTGRAIYAAPGQAYNWAANWAADRYHAAYTTSSQACTNAAAAIHTRANQFDQRLNRALGGELRTAADLRQNQTAHEQVMQRNASILQAIQNNLDSAYVPFIPGQTAENNIIQKIQHIPGAANLMHQIFEQHHAIFAQYAQNTETNKEIYYLEELRNILTTMNQTQLAELSTLTTEINMGRLTLNQAIKKASPYVKKAIIYFVGATIFVILANIFIPEIACTGINYIYFGILSIPFKIASWSLWAASLPFKLYAWFKTRPLSNQLIENSKSLSNQLIESCINSCVQRFKNEGPGILKAIQEACRTDCTTIS